MYPFPPRSSPEHPVCAQGPGSPGVHGSGTKDSDLIDAAERTGEAGPCQPSRHTGRCLITDSDGALGGRRDRQKHLTGDLACSGRSGVVLEEERSLRGALREEGLGGQLGEPSWQRLRSFHAEAPRGGAGELLGAVAEFFCFRGFEPCFPVDAETLLWTWASMERPLPPAPGRGPAQTTFQLRTWALRTKARGSSLSGTQDEEQGLSREQRPLSRSRLLCQAPCWLLRIIKRGLWVWQVRARCPVRMTSGKPHFLFALSVPHSVVSHAHRNASGSVHRPSPTGAGVLWPPCI